MSLVAKINLTASMRSNLLSLQNISKQVSSTQNNLATGKKVNSAIDNPSSYYTAASLNNRAKDLDALLDSMGQAVSAIKAATTALEAGADFLEQAAAVATGALETATVPAKSYFEDKGTVVTTAQELKDAVAAGKETIVVYGKIDYFENENITLKDGQKLVGTEYYTGYTGKAKFSELNFKSNINSAAIYVTANSTISDLSINHNNSADVASAITIRGNNVKLNNLDLKLYQAGAAGVGHGVISVIDQDNLSLSGTINIDGAGGFGSGIYGQGTSINITSDAQINIKTNFSSIDSPIWLYNGSTINVFGKLNMQSSVAGITLGENTASGNTINFRRGSEVAIKTTNSLFVLGRAQNDDFYNSINFEKGSILYAQTNLGQASLLSNGTQYSSLTSGQYYKLDDILSDSNLSNINKDLPEFPTNLISDYISPSTSNAKQYAEILSQYDNLVNDSSYKGTLLLRGEQLNVRFNEKGTSTLEVTGQDMSAATLGLNTVDWQTQGDIAQSLAEISAALKSIRSFSAELGNHYSVITTRRDFTENLINILGEGADKLTLADMNEESANILALQTRQQLAINSLSLASQTSQAILKLF